MIKQEIKSYIMFGNQEILMILNYLKKLKETFGNLEQSFLQSTLDCLLSGIKPKKTETIVVATHGFIKKTQKTPKSEIERAEKIREQYFKERGGE